MQRETLFISHATPEDNDFTIWLASRLQLLGYEIWIDKNSLIGGEKFWQEIDQTIRNKTAKFLLVYSKDICQKDEYGNSIAGKLKDGISKEFSLAESIAKQHDLSDFIILLNIDRADYNLFIGADRLNQIPFFDNWAEGLKQLDKKLKKDEIPKNSLDIESNFGDWYENQYVIQRGIISTKELYYTNWWTINRLPEFYYIYQFQYEDQAKTIYEQESIFPISKITNCLSSFEPNLFVEQQNEFAFRPQNVFEVKISDVRHVFESENFPTQKDAENHLKQLLKRIFHLIMKNRKMFWYEMANKRLAYFYTPANLHFLKVKFEYPYRSNRRFKTNKTKQLIGKYESLGKWHFAVSVKPILSPIIAFSLKSHLTFTDNGFNVWKNKDGEVDKDRIHSHRRTKGKRFFNEEWRDMLLAFLNGLKKDDKIEITLSNDFILEMPLITEVYWSDFGYYDPKDKTRQGILSVYEIELDEREEETEEEKTAEESNE